MTNEQMLLSHREVLMRKYNDGTISEERFHKLYLTLQEWIDEYRRKVSTLEIKLFT